jgi:protein phosphatase
MDRARRRALSPLLDIEEYTPISSLVRVQIAARSARGISRTLNDDHFLAVRLGRFQETIATSLQAADLPSRFEEQGYAMVIADGLEGTNAGSVASRVAISTLAHLAIHFGRWNLRVDGRTASEILDRSEWFYRQASEAVYRQSQTNPSLTGMATTLTAVYSAGEDIFLAHVGHSRAYLYRDGDLTLLTSDQTLERQLASNPRPSAVDPSTQDLGHILTNIIGSRPGAVDIEIEHFRVLNGDRVLLCTNGLTDVIEDDRIADVLAQRRSPAEECQILIDMALEHETPDNVTVMLADYRLPPKAEKQGD